MGPKSHYRWWFLDFLGSWFFSCSEDFDAVDDSVIFPVIPQLASWDDTDMVTTDRDNFIYSCRDHCSGKEPLDVEFYNCQYCG